MANTLKMILAVGIEKRKHALDVSSYTSWINWKNLFRFHSLDGFKSGFNILPCFTNQEK